MRASAPDHCHQQQQWDVFIWLIAGLSLVGSVWILSIQPDVVFIMAIYIRSDIDVQAAMTAHDIDLCRKTKYRHV